MIRMIDEYDIEFVVFLKTKKSKKGKKKQAKKEKGKGTIGEPRGKDINKS